MDYITIQYLNYLQYGPYTSFNTVQFHFFNNESFNSYNKYPIANNIFTKQNTRQENTKTKGGGWEHT